MSLYTPTTGHTRSLVHDLMNELFSRNAPRSSLQSRAQQVLCPDCDRWIDVHRLHGQEFVQQHCRVTCFKINGRYPSRSVTCVWYALPSVLARFVD